MSATTFLFCENSNERCINIVVASVIANEMRHSRGPNGQRTLLLPIYEILESMVRAMIRRIRSRPRSVHLRLGQCSGNDLWSSKH